MLGRAPTKGQLFMGHLAWVHSHAGSPRPLGKVGEHGGKFAEQLGHWVLSTCETGPGQAWGVPPGTMGSRADPGHGEGEEGKRHPLPSSSRLFLPLLPRGPTPFINSSHTSQLSGVSLEGPSSPPHPGADAEAHCLSPPPAPGWAWEMKPQARALPVPSLPPHPRAVCDPISAPELGFHSAYQPGPSSLGGISWRDPLWSSLSLPGSPNKAQTAGPPCPSRTGRLSAPCPGPGPPGFFPTEWRGRQQDQDWLVTISLDEARKLHQEQSETASWRR